MASGVTRSYVVVAERFVKDESNLPNTFLILMQMVPFLSPFLRCVSQSILGNEFSN